MAKHCSECGAKLKEGAKFCPECGNKISEHHKEKKVEEKHSEKKRIFAKPNKLTWILLSIVGIIVLVWLVAASGIFNGASQAKPTASDSPIQTLQQEQKQQTYCGDGTCQSGETCSSCQSDCGTCKGKIGDSCSFNSDCQGSYCVHSICRQSSTYCGDGYCDSGESRNSCRQDCLRYMSLTGTSPKALCEMGDGNIAVSENGNNRIGIYSLESGNLVNSYSIGTPDSTLYCMGSKVLLSGYDNGNVIREVEVSSGSVIYEINSKDLDCLKSSTDNRALLKGSNWIVSCYGNGKYNIYEINPVSKSTLSTKFAYDVRSIFLKDNKIGYANADTIYLYSDVSNSFETQAFMSGAAIQSVSVLRNGNYLVTTMSQVYEVSPSGNILKQGYFSDVLNDAKELSNGNWVVLSTTYAKEVNPNALSSSSGGVSSIAIAQN